MSFCAQSAVNNSYEVISTILKYNKYVYACNDRYYADKKNHWSYLQDTIAFYGVWMGKYLAKKEMIITPYGWCSIMNLVPYDKMFKPNSTNENFKPIVGSLFTILGFDYKNLNETPPLYTPKKQIGFVANIAVSQNLFRQCTNKFNNDNWQISVVIHSPHELPDIRHQTLRVDKGETFKIYVTPEIRITDETLLGLDVDEYTDK